jgi:Protein of unknown function (DUF1769)
MVNGDTGGGSSASIDDHLGEMHAMMSASVAACRAASVAAPCASLSSSRNNSTDDLESLGRAVDELDALELLDNDDSHVGQHPALKTMCVVDCDNNTRIIPNGPPAILDNECFVGKVMLLIRTPDVDDLEAADNLHNSMSKIPHFKLNHQASSNSNLQAGGESTSAAAAAAAAAAEEPGGIHLAETPARISQYLKHKKRRFEFQFQVRLKRIPTGPLFLGCELEHAIRVGTITKGLVGILLAMVRRINPGFHYTWGTLPEHHGADHAQFRSGQYEKTHLSFPVEASMDRIVISKPGEALPELGHELDETLDSVKRRRRLGSGSVDWNLHDTYTMCLWSAYCDWIQWKSLNVPGMSPFSLSRVTGLQPIYLSVYEIANVTPAEYRKKRGGVPHTRKHLRVYTRLEFSNDERTVGGIAEQLLGKSTQAKLLGSSGGGGMMGDAASLPDTESVHSDFETKSRVTVL